MRLNRKIDWRIIRDGSGREYETGDWSRISPRQHVNIWLDLFTDIGSRYDLPKWLNQPKKVVVVCEKEADYPIVKSVVSDLNVDTAYLRGYSGWRIFFEAVEKIREEGKQPEIVALADFDPSGGEGAKKEGKDLVSHILKALLKLGLENVHVEKVLVTKEQIEKFKLPHRPEDEKEIQKLQRDPRFKTWPYGLYRVETAALRAKAPDFFDKTIRDAVMKHFDQQIWQKVQKAQEEARKKITEFFESQQDLIDELRNNINKSDKLTWEENE
jgi:hypothetical protein